MFDPTAYENMKVVIEGYLYDKDLDEEISIVDRNDMVNLAKLSREYSIRFRLRIGSREQDAIFRLKASLENLSSELLSGGEVSNTHGCSILVHFVLKHSNEPQIYQLLQNGLQQIWGDKRTIQQCVHIDPINKSHDIQNKITIEFNRLILEEQIDDLLNLIDHTIESLTWLNRLEY